MKAELEKMNLMPKLSLETEKLKKENEELKNEIGNPFFSKCHH